MGVGAGRGNGEKGISQRGGMNKRKSSERDGARREYVHAGQESRRTKRE